MLKHIIIGRYLPTNSLLHRLDVRTKIIASISYIFCVFHAKSWFEYLLLFLTICGGVVLSKVPARIFLKSFIPVLFFACFTFILHLIFTKEGKMVFSLGFFEIYSGGLQQGAFIFMRVLLLVAMSSMLTITTTSIEIVNGLAFFLTPLRFLKIPVNQFALMVAIALRFIPTLLNEVDKISKAQMSRGSSFTSKSLKKKILGVVALMVPLFVHSFKYAENLAQSMEARGYRTDYGGRTKFRILRMKVYDYVMLVIVASYVVLMFRFI